jgi:hypothetical protein
VLIPFQRIIDQLNLQKYDVTLHHEQSYHEREKRKTRDTALALDARLNHANDLLAGQVTEITSTHELDLCGSSIPDLEAAEVPLQALEHAEGGSIPGGGVLDVVAWQPDLLSRACKGAQEGNKPGVGRVGGNVTGDDVVGDTETALFMRLMEQYVNPSTVLLPGVPGEGVAVPTDDGVTT